jgi:hypothetical protein
MWKVCEECGVGGGDALVTVDAVSGFLGTDLREELTVDPNYRNTPGAIPE